jgi:hypothetical protein
MSIYNSNFRINFYDSVTEADTMLIKHNVATIFSLETLEKRSEGFNFIDKFGILS